MDMKLPPILCGRFGSKIGHAFVCFQVFGSAIGIAAVINGINAQEYIVGACDFSICEGEGEKNGIPGRNIGDWYLLRHLCKASRVRHIKIGGQRTSTKSPQIDANRLLLLDSIVPGNSSSSFYFSLVTLPVIKRKRM